MVPWEDFVLFCQKIPGDEAVNRSERSDRKERDAPVEEELLPGLNPIGIIWYEDDRPHEEEGGEGKQTEKPQGGPGFGSEPPDIPERCDRH